MAAGPVVLFRKNLDRLSLVDLAGATVKLALVTSSQTMDSTNTGNSLWADMSANEIAAGANYTAGGWTLASLAVATITNGFKFSSASVSQAVSSGTVPAWRYAVIYVSGTLWGRVNPVIGYFLGDSTPADVPATTTSNTPLQLNCPATGWFGLTEA